jgi:hypothetical protein
VEEDYRRVKEDKIYPLRSIPGGGKKGGKKAKQTWRPSAGGPMEFIKSVAQGNSSFIPQDSFATPY